LGRTDEEQFKQWIIEEATNRALERAKRAQEEGKPEADFLKLVQEEMQQITSTIQEPQNRGNVYASFCQNCLREAPTKYVELHQNIGMIFMRSSKSIKGNLCRTCIKKYFWEYTLITFFAGWWGVISFFFTLFILPNNLIRYLSSLGLSEPK